MIDPNLEESTSARKNEWVSNYLKKSMHFSDHKIIESANPGFKLAELQIRDQHQKLHIQYEEDQYLQQFLSKVDFITNIDISRKASGLWILFSDLQKYITNFEFTIYLKAKKSPTRTIESPKTIKSTGTQTQLKLSQIGVVTQDSTSDSEEEKLPNNVTDFNKSDQNWKQFLTKPPLGLKNLGATCYFNGVIQIILSHTPELQWIKFKQLKKCMTRYYFSTKAKPVNLKPLMKQLNIKMASPGKASKNKKIQGWNDSINAYTALLEFLKKSKGEEEVNEYFQILRLGEYKGKKYIRRAHFMLLSPTHSNNSLASMLFTECKSSHSIQKLVKVPKYLVLSINRHESYYGQLYLNDTKVKFSEYFEFPQTLTDDIVTSPIECELVGAVQQEYGGQHIVCFVKKHKTWYLCNDEEVKPVRGSSQISRSRVCLLIYKTHAQNSENLSPCENGNLHNPQNSSNKLHIPSKAQENGLASKNQFLKYGNRYVDPCRLYWFHL